MNHLIESCFTWSVKNEPAQDRTYKMACAPAKTQISLGIHLVWSESLLSAWRKLESLASHWVQSKHSDQTGQMPRLIWVFAALTSILLVLSWAGSNISESGKCHTHEVLFSPKNNNNKITFIIPSTAVVTCTLRVNVNYIKHFYPWVSKMGSFILEFGLVHWYK